MAAVEVSSLVRRYSPDAGISDVSFEAPDSAVTALLGRNGAGKTTTVEICCGLRRADSGEARVLGLDPTRDGRKLRGRLGVMPQAGGSGASGVYPSVRVEEALQSMTDALALTRPLHRPLLEGQIALAIAQIKRRQGHLAQAREWAEQAQAQFDLSGSTLWRRNAGDELALLAESADDGRPESV